MTTASPSPRRSRSSPARRSRPRRMACVTVAPIPRRVHRDRQLRRGSREILEDLAADAAQTLGRAQPGRVLRRAAARGARTSLELATVSWHRWPAPVSSTPAARGARDRAAALKFPRLASMLTPGGGDRRRPGPRVALRLGEAARLHARHPGARRRDFWDELFGPGDLAAAGCRRCSPRCSIVAPQTIRALNAGDLRSRRCAAADADRRLAGTGRACARTAPAGSRSRSRCARRRGAPGDLGLPDLRRLRPRARDQPAFRSQRRPWPAGR